MSTGREPFPLGNASHTLHPSLACTKCLWGVLNLNKTSDLRQTLFLLDYTDVGKKKSSTPKHHNQSLRISKHLFVRLPLKETFKKRNCCFVKTPEHNQICAS